MIDDIGKDLIEMSPIEVTRDGDRAKSCESCSNRWVTETGQLQIWCVARDSTRRWKLEFNVRGADQELNEGWN